MKTQNVILAIALVLILSGTARSQTTTDCTGTPGHMTCTTNTPNQLSPYEQQRAASQAAHAAQQQAEASALQAEASCVGGGGTFYEGHCLTQQQYDEKRKQDDEKRKQETEWVAQQQALKNKPR